MSKKSGVYALYELYLKDQATGSNIKVLSKNRCIEHLQFEKLAKFFESISEEHCPKAYLHISSCYPVDKEYNLTLNID